MIGPMDAEEREDRAEGDRDDACDHGPAGDRPVAELRHRAVTTAPPAGVASWVSTAGHGKARDKRHVVLRRCAIRPVERARARARRPPADRQHADVRDEGRHGGAVDAEPEPKDEDRVEESATAAPISVMYMARCASPAERRTADAHMPPPAAAATAARYADSRGRAPACVRSRPASRAPRGKPGHKAAPRSGSSPPAANTAACVESRRARARSRAPSAGATSAVTAIDMPMPAEIMKNRMVLA